jgi:hypothetical protein
VQLHALSIVPEPQDHNLSGQTCVSATRRFGISFLDQKFNYINGGIHFNFEFPLDEFAQTSSAMVVKFTIDGDSLPRKFPKTASMACLVNLIGYRKAGNLRAVQLHGHTTLESTVRYLGVELDDALAISEQVEL